MFVFDSTRHGTRRVFTGQQRTARIQRRRPRLRKLYLQKGNPGHRSLAHFVSKTVDVVDILERDIKSGEKCGHETG